MEKTATWCEHIEHTDHAELTETSNNWAWSVPEVPNDYFTKRHPALKHSPSQHTDLINAVWGNFLKTFCCYNCLDFTHGKWVHYKVL